MCSYIISTDIDYWQTWWKKFPLVLGSSNAILSTIIGIAMNLISSFKDEKDSSMFVSHHALQQVQNPHIYISRAPTQLVKLRDKQIHFMLRWEIHVHKQTKMKGQARMRDGQQ